MVPKLRKHPHTNWDSETCKILLKKDVTGCQSWLRVAGTHTNSSPNNSCDNKVYDMGASHRVGPNLVLLALLDSLFVQGFRPPWGPFRLSLTSHTHAF